jgi:hypothetical protein
VPQSTCGLTAARGRIRPSCSSRRDGCQEPRGGAGPPAATARRAAAPSRGDRPLRWRSFDCPALDTLFLAAPVANKGSLTQYVGRILRTNENKTSAEVHDYLDERTSVLAAMLAKRAPGYAGLGFPDPRRLARTPSADTNTNPAPGSG